MMTEAEEPPGGLRARAARGMLWTGGQAVFVRVLSLASFVVLARLLSPEEYGLVTLANVFVVFLGVFAAAGVSPTLVQRTELTRRDMDSAFWGSLAAGLVLSGALVALAHPIAEAFDEPELRSVLQVLAVCFPFIALGTVPTAVLSRELRFEATANAMIGANVLATVVGISAAFAGLGVWALVSQTVLSIAALSVINLVSSRYRPGRDVSLREGWRILVSGGPFAGATLAELLNQRSGDFAAGAALNSAAVGVWGVSNRILSILFETLALSARIVAFPIFTKVQDDRAALARVYLNITRLSAVISVPVFLTAAAVAPELIPVVFGDKWEASVPIMQVLCLMGPLTTVTLFNSSVLQAAGRARAVLNVTVAGAVIQCVGFVFVASYGLEWIAWTMVIRAALISPIEFTLAARRTGIPAWKAPVSAVPSVVAGAAGFAAVSATRALISGSMSDAFSLPILAAVGLVTYVVILWAVRRSDLRDAMAFGRQAVSGRAA